MTDPGETVKTIEIRTAKLWRHPDGFVVVQMKPRVRETLDDARELVEAGTRLAGTPNYALFVDLRAPFSMDPGVREFYARRAETKALALLIDSGFGRVAGNLFLSLNVPKFPTRLFTTEDDAVRWLKKVTKGASP